MLKTPSLRNALVAMSRQFEAIKSDTLSDEFSRIVRGSPRTRHQRRLGCRLGEASGAMPAAQMGRQEALRRYATDLTEKARKDEIDPVSGRDEEIRQIVDILMRRRQNNPILTGEAGVGKTAVVEGFAVRLVRGDVPPALKDVSLLTLDIGLLQAGASMKGEFENRLRQVIEEVQSSPKPIILFVDEAHTLIGAGGAQGTGDAANLLVGAGARHPADDRGDDLGGIQEVHRERPRAHPPLPGGAGGRAHRAQRDPDGRGMASVLEAPSRAGAR